MLIHNHFRYITSFLFFFVQDASPNISQSTESAVSAAVNDKIRSNEGDNTKDKISSKAKGKNQINSTAKINGSFVNESEVNYFENQRTEVS